VAERGAAVFVPADLSCGDDVKAGFNRPRAKQSVPMRLSRGHGEGRWHRDHVRVRLGDAREQHRKPKVIADGEAELPYRRAVDDHRPFAGAIDRRLAPALAGRKVDVEQMDLVVARLDPAGAVDHEAAVGDLAVPGQHREGPEVNPDVVLARGLAAGGEDAVLVLLAQITGGALRIAVEQARHLGREQHGRTAARRLADRGYQAFAVGRWVDPRVRLEDGNFGHWANRSSSLPSRSSAMRSSQPPMCRPAMKICGTVVRPLARWIMCWRTSPPKSTAISAYSTPFSSSRCLARQQ
jgi:hypothetical protein